MVLSPNDPEGGHFSPSPKGYIGQSWVQYLISSFLFNLSSWHPFQWIKRQPSGVSKGKLGLFPIGTGGIVCVLLSGDQCRGGCSYLWFWRGCKLSASPRAPDCIWAKENAQDKHRGAVGLVPTGEFTPRQTSKVLIFTQDQVQLYRTPPATSTRRTGSNGQLSGWIHRNRELDSGFLSPDYDPRHRMHN